MSIVKFLEYLEFEKNYSPQTILNYKLDLDEFQKFYQIETSDSNIHKASKIHLRSYLMKLSGESLSERSINRKISSLKSYYKYLLKIEQIKISPVSGIKTIKQYNKVQLPFSEDELNSLFASEEIFPNSFGGVRDKLIMDLFYQTGMRRNELIQLKISDINFSDKNIKVLGKRNKERIIPLNDDLLNLLKTYIYSRLIQFSDSQELLFLTPKGKPLYDKFVYNIVNHYLSVVSTKHKKSPHMLRHSFATHLLNRGAELNAVKELLGHSSLSATQVYTHGSIEQLKNVFNDAHPRVAKKRNDYDN
ncbi:tyrosine-type recombinase/integrase [Moheibacter sediminis]|uniref:Integrase/recombinase XerC n=1 Tax=Moheibacter sediminis TaxID=1434700 RepID=A0A1W1ZV59_9FLAO|nr:tyrosine-type recombinase/integrase [Moheibacter sediminis]SMC51938.1 integrase/recombinase XerC [Moheibacter sediminis]